MDDLNKYLSELINRNLQFKRESGFTNYVLIEIKTLEVYAGKLPNRQMKKVMEWASNNQDFLIGKWNEFNPNA
jgi:hypothetical protein